MKELLTSLHNAVLHILSLVVLAAMPSIGLPGELYPSGAVRTFQQFEPLESDATGGGYAIFQGGRPWRMYMAKVDRNNLDIGISYLQMISPMGNEYFAEMITIIALGGGDASVTSYYGGEPCTLGVDALVRLNKGIGRSDNCLTINPLTLPIQGKSVPTMAIRVRNSQSASRLYDINLLLALDKLGFPNSKDADWAASQINNDNTKKQFIKKIGAWGEQLQDAVNKALAFNKPQDAFQKVPPIDTLLPTE